MGAGSPDDGITTAWNNASEAFGRSHDRKLRFRSIAAPQPKQRSVSPEGPERSGGGALLSALTRSGAEATRNDFAAPSYPPATARSHIRSNQIDVNRAPSLPVARPAVA